MLPLYNNISKSLRWLLILVIISAVSACGGSGGSSKQYSNEEVVSFSGVAQLGYLSGATVKLFNLNNELIAQTITSTSENVSEGAAFPLITFL